MRTVGKELAGPALAEAVGEGEVSLEVEVHHLGPLPARMCPAWLPCPHLERKIDKVAK